MSKFELRPQHFREKMKFYLSSFRLGNDIEKLKSLIPADNHKFGYIPNALDFSKDTQRLASHVEADLSSLREVGMLPELLDLKDYFGKKDSLQKKLSELGGVWISGGNTFVLRQAMKISDMDEILRGPTLRKNFLYGGYSAAGCVLGPDLRAYQVVDDPKQLPYTEIREVIWEGLGLLDYAFMPHFESDHSESEAIGKEIEYCQAHGIPFKSVRDGEVIVIE